MSKMKKIEAIIFAVLQDKEWHSLTELKNEIRLQDETLLQNENYLNVILSRLKNKKHQIELKGKGIYRMITENEEMKEIKTNKERVLSGWRNYYDTMIKNPKPNYDMSEEEFRQGKWLYELNREIEKTISLFPEYTKD